MKYSVIYADPPWSFETYSKKGLDKSAQKHYTCMDLKDICDMEVAELAADNCVLFMWTTDPFLEKSFEVIKAWGFKYKTVGFCWIKENAKSPGLFKGTGYWTRANTEYCLLATRGSPKRISKNVDTAIIAKRREHSRKPDEIYDRIEQLVDGPYIEMFARNKREGWDSFGNETEKFQSVIKKNTLLAFVE